MGVGAPTGSRRMGGWAGGPPPATWRSRAQPQGGGAGRVAALLLGAGYVVIGVLGFIATGFTGFVADTDDALLGFDLNIFHNIVHLAIGATLILVSRAKDVTVTQGVLIGIGLFYILAALLGFLDEMQIISIDSALAADNFLHLISGLFAFLFGVISARQQEGAIARAPATTPEGEPLPIEERREMWER
jgi:Domain of unknown function (DUF4383)